MELKEIDKIRQDINTLKDISKETRKCISDTRLYIAEAKADVRSIIKELNQELKDLGEYVSDLNSIEINDNELKEYKHLLNSYKGSLLHSRKSDSDDELISKGMHNLRVSFVNTRAKLIDILEPFGKIKDEEYQTRFREVQKAMNVITKFYLDQTK